LVSVYSHFKKVVIPITAVGDVLKTIKRPSISGGERRHSRSRTQPASEAIRSEVRGKQDAPSKGLIRESYNSMNGRKGRRVQNGDRRKSEYRRGQKTNPKSGSITF
jgi:hypothetical protein